MRTRLPRPPQVLWIALFVLAPLVVVAERAHAQVNPAWDHYKVYAVVPNGELGGSRLLMSDQFGPYEHRLLLLEQFMNPTEKRVAGQPPSGITSPDLHYSWRSISPQPFSAIVTAANQFGDQTLNVHDAVSMLNPARLDQTGAPPFVNHYKCYVCDGPPVNIPVQLDDQFGPWAATVTFPRFFCNPTEVWFSFPFGPRFTISDANQHYICYEFEPEDPTPHAGAISDVIYSSKPYSTPMNPSRYLCVPTYKTGFTSTTPGTWGRLKVLYR